MDRLSVCTRAKLDAVGALLPKLGLACRAATRSRSSSERRCALGRDGAPRRPAPRRCLAASPGPISRAGPPCRPRPRRAPCAGVAPRLSRRRAGGPTLPAARASGPPWPSPPERRGKGFIERDAGSDRKLTRAAQIGLNLGEGAALRSSGPAPGRPRGRRPPRAGGPPGPWRAQAAALRVGQAVVRQVVVQAIGHAGPAASRALAERADPRLRVTASCPTQGCGVCRSPIPASVS